MHRRAGTSQALVAGALAALLGFEPGAHAEAARTTWEQLMPKPEAQGLRLAARPARGAKAAKKAAEPAPDPAAETRAGEAKPAQGAEGEVSAEAAAILQTGQEQAAEASEEPPALNLKAARTPQVKKKPRIDEDKSIYKQWWFWGLTAAVVGAIVVGVVVVSGGQTARARGCMPGIVCFGDGRSSR